MAGRAAPAESMHASPSRSLTTACTMLTAADGDGAAKRCSAWESQFTLGSCISKACSATVRTGTGSSGGAGSLHASQTPQLYGHIEVRLQRFSASKVSFGNDLIISIRSASCQTVEFPLSSPKRCSIEAIAYPLLLPTLKSTAARGGRLASPKSLGASTSSHRAVGQEDSCATSSAVDSVGQGATISMMCACAARTGLAVLPVLPVRGWPCDRPSGYAMRPSVFCFASGASRVIMPGPCRRA